MKVEFMYYPGGKRKALTLSYDDGTEFDRRLVEIMNKYGIKGTFHLNSSNIDSGNRFVTSRELKGLYKGHEVSLHGREHLFLANVPDQMLIEEIREDRKFFEKNVGYIVNGLSYAMGSYSKEVIKKLRELGILYSRTTKSRYDFAVPEDFLEWEPTIHHNDPKLMEMTKNFAETPDWLRRMPLFYLWGHSYEFDDNNNWEVIEEFCKYVSGFDNIWFATNMEVYEYIKALKALKFSADCNMVYNPSAISVWIGVDKEPREIKSGELVRL